MTTEPMMAEPATIRIARHGRVATITLDRPKALNALNARVLQELTAALATLDADPEVGCLVVTGSDKAFAAGADIREMAERTAMDMMLADHFAGWDAIARIRKPIVAAVAGYALGGGCELAMMCDFIIAADTAKFGQPEIKLGVMPGMGGTQRLARAIGTAKAMELCLTGRTMDAAEAERAGLVVRVVPAEQLQAEALATATAIAGMSLPAVLMIKEAIHRTNAMSLAEGIAYERRIFHGLFGTHDQKEGMAAFLAKRPAQFTHR